MPRYSYQAIEQSGSKTKGHIGASDIESAMHALQKEQLHVLSLEPISETRSPLFFLKHNKVSFSELEFLTSELALLLKNGVKIDKGLALLASGSAGSPLGNLLGQMHRDVKKGLPLSEAMREQNVFDALYLNVVKIGEETGHLADVFESLSKDLKFRKTLRSKIVQALTYPAVILIVCILVVLAVFNFIVPQMAGLFESNDSLPLYTRALLSLSDWMQGNQFWLFIFIGIVFFGIRYMFVNRRESSNLDELVLKVPLLGSAIVQVEGIRFNNGMAIMLDAGINIDKAMGLATESVKNLSLKRQLISAKEGVRKGVSFSESVRNSQLYTQLMRSLLEVGEESGALSAVFREIADRGRESFENWTSRVTSLLEPLMILVMGVIVGGVVVVMLLSIMSVNEGF